MGVYSRVLVEHPQLSFGSEHSLLECHASGFHHTSICVTWFLLGFLSSFLKQSVVEVGALYGSSKRMVYVAGHQMTDVGLPRHLMFLSSLCLRSDSGCNGSRGARWRAWELRRWQKLVHFNRIHIGVYTATLGTTKQKGLINISWYNIIWAWGP